jgi:hypothetical protein
MNLACGAERVDIVGNTQHIRYTPVKHTERRSGACPQCGKKNTRSSTFERTVSPYNKHEDGTPKTYAEVHADVRALAAKWEPDFTCSAHHEAEEPAPLEHRTPSHEVTVAIMRTMRRAMSFAEEHGLSIHPGVTVRPDRIEMAFLSRDELVRWARSLDQETVAVRTYKDRDNTYLDLSAAGGPCPVHLTAIYGRKLGAKDDVQWGVDRHGKRGLRGSMTVEALAALPERSRS